MPLRSTILTILIGCTADDPTGSSKDTALSTTRPWTGSQPDAATIVAPDGFEVMRAITHLHSAWSHDACDGDPLPGGEPDPSCLADLRAALCTLQIDAAYLSDHPTHAGDQGYDALVHLRDEDERVEGGAWMACPDGEPVLLRPGIEGGMMPLGLERHIDTLDLYGDRSPAAIAEAQAAGAVVFTAHTEGRTLEDLIALQAAGLQGVEAFNIHAMFDPSIREEDLGLERLGWLTDIAPFSSPDGDAEPDLLFLGVLGEQAPSIAAWDALSAIAPTVGIGGSDAHQNVYPVILRDGERGDSYRRMLRWMSNHLLATERSRAAADEALAAGRLSVVFEVLGTPSGLDVAVTQSEQRLLPGSRASWSGGTLSVACPTLHPESPQGPDAPDITASVFKDGVPWAEGCGDHALDGPGVYRVRFDILPWHLAPFLGSDADPWLKTWPWVYTNPITLTE